HGARGFDNGVVEKYRARQESRTRATGDSTAEQHHREDSGARAEEGEVSAEPQLHPGDVRQRDADFHSGFDALPDLRARDHRRPVLLMLDLLLLYLRPPARSWECDEHLSGDRGIAQQLRKYSQNAEGA